MRAGRLRTRLKLQSPSTNYTVDSMGDPDAGWQTDATLYAETLDTSADQEFESSEDTASMTRTWRIRHRGGVTTNHRLVEEGDTSAVWDITGTFDPNGRREELRINTRRIGI